MSQPKPRRFIRLKRMMLWLVLGILGLVVLGSLYQIVGTALDRRAYSIASAKQNRDYLEFLIVHVDRGRLTPRLWALPTGAQLWLEPVARGDFTLDRAPPTRLN